MRTYEMLSNYSGYIAAMGVVIGGSLVVWSAGTIIRLMRERRSLRPTGEIHDGPEAPF